MNSSSQRAMTPTKAQIGRAGELLVQTKLLLGGIESAQMTTDTGIDLVAYSAIASAAITIQVKSNLQPKPAGGKGKPHFGWWVPTDCPADFVAFVDLQESRVWIVRTTELPEVAQQHSTRGYHLFMSVDPAQPKRRDGKPVHEYEFTKYLLENRLHDLF